MPYFLEEGLVAQKKGTQKVTCAVIALCACAILQLARPMCHACLNAGTGTYDELVMNWLFMISATVPASTQDHSDFINEPPPPRLKVTFCGFSLCLANFSFLTLTSTATTIYF